MDIGELGVSSTEAGSWIVVMGGAWKDVSGDASGRDASRRAELVLCADKTA